MRQSQEGTHSQLAHTGRRINPVPLVVAILLIYLVFAAAGLWSGLRFPMQFDSTAFLESKQSVFQEHDPLKVVAIGPDRPLSMLMFYLDYRIDDMNPLFFRLTGILLLGLTGLALMFVSIIALESPSLNLPGEKSEKRWGSVFIGLIFVIHPVQVYGVLYVWQHPAMLSTMFYLATLATYLASAEGGIRRRWAGYVLTSLLFTAGQMSKGALISLPIVMALAELILLKRSLRELPGRLILIAVISLPPAMATVAAPAIFQSPDSHIKSIIERLRSYYFTGGLTIYEVALTESRVLLRYLGGIALPFLIKPEFIRAEIVSTSLFNPPTTAIAVGSLILIVSGALALVRRLPLTAFGICFFLIASLPECFLTPQYSYFGYRMILPMAGVLLAAAHPILAVLSWLDKRSRTFPVKAVMVISALITVLGLLTMTKIEAANWAPDRLWKKAFINLPRLSENTERLPFLDIVGRYARILNNENRRVELIEDLRDVGVLKQIVKPDQPVGSADSTEPTAQVEFSEIFKTFAGRDPGKTKTVQTQTANALRAMGRSDRAEKIYRKVLAANPDYHEAHYHLGRLFADKGDSDGAEKSLTKAVELDPNIPMYWNSLGLLMEKKGRLREAERLYRRAVKLAPNFALAQYNLGSLFMRKKDYERAVEHLRLAIGAKKDFPQAHANLGYSLLVQGRSHEASESFKAALKLGSGDAELYNALGVALIRQGRRAEAKKSFEKAISLRPDFQDAKINLEMMRSP